MKIYLTSRSRIERVASGFEIYYKLEYRIKWLFWYRWVTVGTSSQYWTSDAIEEIGLRRKRKKLAKRYSGFYEYRFFINNN